MRLSMDIKALRGPLVVWVPPPPGDRLWFSFLEPPQLQVTASPLVSNSILIDLESCRGCLMLNCLLGIVPFPPPCCRRASYTCYNILSSVSSVLGQRGMMCGCAEVAGAVSCASAHPNMQQESGQPSAVHATCIQLSY